MQNNIDEELNRVQSWSLADQLALLNSLAAKLRRLPSYQDILAQAQLLSIEEKSRLLAELMADLNRRIEEQQQPKKLHSIMELKGLGKEIWQGVDVEKYIDELRNSW